MTVDRAGARMLVHVKSIYLDDDGRPTVELGFDDGPRDFSVQRAERLSPRPVPEG